MSLRFWLLSVTMGFVASNAASVELLDRPLVNSISDDFRCLNSSESPSICLGMYQLRAYISLLDRQRDLMLWDYEFFARVGDGMSIVAAGLLVDMADGKHIRALTPVRDMAAEMSSLADRRHIDTFKIANSLKQNCRSCHKSAWEESDLPSFEEIFGASWQELSVVCNQPGKNPLVCRYMHSMVRDFDYFQSSLHANNFEFELGVRVADSLLTAAKTLRSLGDDIHPGGESVFSDVERRAGEIRGLAESEDPRYLIEAQSLRHACQSCHTQK